MVDRIIREMREDKLKLLKEYLSSGRWGLPHKGRGPGKTRESKASQENRSVILRFIQERELDPKKSLTTHYGYVMVLHNLAEYLKEKKFHDATRDDLFNYLVGLKERGLRETSYSTQMSMIKLFYKWLHGGEQYPECVKWIKLRGEAIKLKSEDLLTSEEIQQLILATEKVKEKALIAMLSETTMRIGELVGIKMKDMRFDEYGILVNVDGKTGPRAQRIIDAVPYVINYLKYHPSIKDKANIYYKENNFTNGQEKGRLIIDRDDDPYLFFPKGHIDRCERDESRKITCQKPHHADMPLSKNAVFMLLRRVVKKAGIKKHVHPHLFRHTAITQLAKKLSTPVLNSYAGWSPNSNMAKTYIHLSDTSIDDAILRSMYNFTIEKKEEALHSVEVKVCFNCKENNMSELHYCVKCNYPLNKEEFEERIQKSSHLDKIIEERVEQLLSKYMAKLMMVRSK